MNCQFVFNPQVQYYRSNFAEDASISDENETPKSEQYIDADSEWEMNNLAAENELIDTIINERYLVGDVIAVGRTATVRSGESFKWGLQSFKGFDSKLYFHCFFGSCILGKDEDNNSSVAIKFAKPGLTAKLLDNEYRHYLLLEAEGKKVLSIQILIQISNPSNDVPIMA